MNIDWSKAPEGATHYTMCESAINPFLMKNDAGWHYYTHHAGWQMYMEGYADDHTSDVVERPATEWTGTGLPPVGTVCEIHYQNKEWRECEVIAHKKDGDSVLAVAWIDANNLDQSGGIRFRPTRTKEQIEAEERSQAICEMIRVWNVPPTGSEFNFAHDRAEMLYDAGYRKQPKEDA